jgi:hypothetical protein
MKLLFAIALTVVGILAAPFPDPPQGGQNFNLVTKS